jgi:hypothetical protein
MRLATARRIFHPPPCSVRASGPVGVPHVLAVESLGEIGFAEQHQGDTYTTHLFTRT